MMKNNIIVMARKIAISVTLELKHLAHLNNKPNISEHIRKLIDVDIQLHKMHEEQSKPMIIHPGHDPKVQEETIKQKPLSKTLIPDSMKKINEEN